MILITILLLIVSPKIFCFVPSTFLYNFYKMPDSNGFYLDCTLDFNMCTTVIGNSIHLYQKDTNGYVMTAKVEAVCDPGVICSINRNYLKKDGSIAMVYSNADSKFKIYSISNNTFTYVQSISMTSPVARARPLKGNYIALSNLNTMVAYTYNSGTGLYFLAYKYDFATAATLVYDFTEDGLMMVQVYYVSGDNDFTITIH